MNKEKPNRLGWNRVPQDLFDLVHNEAVENKIPISAVMEKYVRLALTVQNKQDEISTDAVGEIEDVSLETVAEEKQGLNQLEFTFYE